MVPAWESEKGKEEALELELGLRELAWAWLPVAWV